MGTGSSEMLKSMRDNARKRKRKAKTEGTANSRQRQAKERGIKNAPDIKVRSTQERKQMKKSKNKAQKLDKEAASNERMGQMYESAKDYGKAEKNYSRARTLRERESNARRHAGVYGKKRKKK